MPPELKTPAKPTDRGASVLPWLAYHGIFPKTPTIRASDYEIVLANPFDYYLKRRLGLSDRLAWSKALSRGSWFHKAFELDNFLTDPSTPTFAQYYYEALSDRLSELHEICDSMGMTPEARSKILDCETKDADTALALYQAASVIRISPKIGTFRTYLSQSKFELLASELTIHVPHPSGLPPFTHLKLVAQFDKLIYNPQKKTLWIVDAKTTADDTVERLALCAIEFQPQHYCFVLQRAITLGTLHKLYPHLPPDITVGGVIHIAVRKPQLEFGTLDRPFKEENHTLKTGPRKGQIEKRRVYTSDEPQFPLYLRRVQNKMTASGPYLSERPERESSPYTNLSWTPASKLIDGHYLSDYNDRLTLICDHATRKPHPDQYLRSSNLSRYGSLDSFAPFYLLEPADWPSVIKHKRLIQAFRDEDLLQ
jgi:hypothetical protein